MWHKLKHLFLSVETYNDLSPDLRVRRRVNRSLSARPELTVDEWFEYHWRSQGISRELADFVYVYFTQYSGLQFSRVVPEDRLDADLCFTLVCWFNWNQSLCDDFWNCFNVNLCDRLDLRDIDTVTDLVTFLNHQLLLVNRS